MKRSGWVMAALLAGCAGPAAEPAAPAAASAVPPVTATAAAPIQEQQQPERAQRWVARGRALREAGERAGAIAAFHHALTHAPLDARIYHQLGLCYADAGDTTREIAEYRKGIALNPRLPELWRDLGHASLIGDDLRGARSAYGRYLELEPGDGRVLYNLAQIEHDLGDPARARELLEAALRGELPDGDRERIQRRLEAIAR